ncbi:Protein arginine N-methyltransferase 2 [Camelus dromedarius]|uniref:Protein arginine N-methyltransferase 2 n=1 Tax=Camelus dromedarius TaxID=9838 RepID=A0A5N4EKJ1_CAMDR|nr:Protein arginine N-methyltransferase 2 [Camelus dromedarius]
MSGGFEFMIESILYARDAWLKEGGVIWPTSAALHLVPCSADRDYRSKVLFWDNAYEFDLSALKSLAIKEFFSKPKYNHILKPEDCLSEPCTILQLDMRTVQITDLETMRGELCFDIRKAGTLHGFTAWFSVRFQNLEEDEPQLVLSTGPLHPTTHWKQVLFMMDEPVSVHAGDVVTGAVVLQRNPVWRRHMSVTLSWSITSRQDPASPKVRHLAESHVLWCWSREMVGLGVITVGDAHPHHTDPTARPCLCHFSHRRDGQWVLLLQNRKRRSRKVSHML